MMLGPVARCHARPLASLTTTTKPRPRTAVGLTYRIGIPARPASPTTTTKESSRRPPPAAARRAAVFSPAAAAGRNFAASESGEPPRRNAVIPTATRATTLRPPAADSRARGRRCSTTAPLCECPNTTGPLCWLRPDLARWPATSIAALLLPTPRPRPANNRKIQAKPPFFGVFNSVPFTTYNSRCWPPSSPCSYCKTLPRPTEASHRPGPL
jgi:hypothetical protein